MAGAQLRPALDQGSGPVRGEVPGPGSSLVGPVDPPRLRSSQRDRSAGPALAETEAQFLGWVRDLARWCHWRTYHTLRSRGSEPGFPDLVLLRPPRMVVAELKALRGRVSRYQREWLEAFEAAGAEVYTWRPADRPEIERILR